MKPIATRSLALALMLATTTPDHAHAQEPREVPPKSVAAAVNKSLVGTLGPATLGAALIVKGAQGMGANEGKVALGIGVACIGLIWGPGVGHVYAENERPMKRGWTRTAGVLIAGLGLGGEGMADSWGGGSSGSGYVIMGIGSLLYLYGAIADFADLPEAVADCNRRHGHTQIRVAPTYLANTEAIGIGVFVAL